MEFGIVGIKSLIGQRSKKSGKELNAYILHLVRDNPRDEGLQGHEVRQQFVDANLMAEDIKKLGGYSMLVGARIDLSYDEGGFVDSIRVLPNVTREQVKGTPQDNTFVAVEGCGLVWLKS